MESRIRIFLPPAAAVLELGVECEVEGSSATSSAAIPLFTEPQDLVERDLGVSGLQDLQEAVPRRELGDGASRSGFKGCRMQRLTLECYIRIFF